MVKWHAVISGRIEPLFQISQKYERTLHNARVCAEKEQLVLQLSFMCPTEL
jgi:hypothetical protein